MSTEGVCSLLRQDMVKGAADLGPLAHSGREEGGVRMQGEPAEAEDSMRCAVHSLADVVPGHGTLAVSGCTGSQERRCGY